MYLVLYCISLGWDMFDALCLYIPSRLPDMLLLQQTRRMMLWPLSICALFAPESYP